METIHIFYSEKEWSPTSSITSLGSIFRAIDTRHGWWEVGVAVKISWSFDTYLAWFQILDSRFYHSRLAYITAKIKNSKSVTGRITDSGSGSGIRSITEMKSEVCSQKVQNSIQRAVAFSKLELQHETRDTGHITRYQPNIRKGNTRW